MEASELEVYTRQVDNWFEHTFMHGLFMVRIRTPHRVVSERDKEYAIYLLEAKHGKGTEG